MRRILIHGARQLLTLRGSSGPRRGSSLNNLGIIEDGAVLMESGVIIEVGPSRRVCNLAESRGAEEIDARGRVVMPGFIDCHAHPVSAPLLSREQPGAASTPQERILLSASLVRDLAAPRLKSDADELLRRFCTHGTTTLSALTGFGLTEPVEMKLLRVTGSLLDAPVQVIPSYFGLHMMPPSVEESRQSFAAFVCGDLVPAVARRGLARVVHAACGPNCFSPEECIRFGQAARESQLSWRLDFGAFGAQSGLRAVLEGAPRSVDHLEWASTDDMLALAESGTLAVLLPAQAFHCNTNHEAPARRMVDSGAPIALGSDCNGATAPGCSMQAAIYLACRHLRLTAAEAINAATFNAAHVVRTSHRMGSLEPGKQADIIMLGTPDYRALGSEFGINLVDMTMKDGQIVYSAAPVA